MYKETLQPSGRKILALFSLKVCMCLWQETQHRGKRRRYTMLHSTSPAWRAALSLFWACSSHITSASLPDFLTSEIKHFGDCHFSWIFWLLRFFWFLLKLLPTLLFFSLEEKTEQHICGDKPNYRSKGPRTQCRPQVALQFRLAGQSKAPADKKKETKVPATRRKFPTSRSKLSLELKDQNKPKTRSEIVIKYRKEQEYTAVVCKQAKAWRLNSPKLSTARQ